MKVHKLPRGHHIAPMPAKRTVPGDGRRLQGGLAPVPYRAQSYCSGDMQHSPAHTRRSRFSFTPGLSYAPMMSNPR